MFYFRAPDIDAAVEWTFEYAKIMREEVETQPAFCIGPDLLVESVARQDLEAVAEQLIRENALRDHWLGSPG